MDGALTIRPATPDDLAAIQDCVTAAYAPYIPLIGRRPAPMDADYAAIIAAGHAHIAAVRQQTVGVVVYYQIDNKMFLENIAIYPHASGKGLGKLLVQHCEYAARSLGLGAVALYTNTLMKNNLSIYPRLGFIQTEHRVQDGFDRVFFEKPLH